MPRLTRSSTRVYWLYHRVPSLTECTACLPQRMRRLIHERRSPCWTELSFCHPTQHKPLWPWQALHWEFVLKSACFDSDVAPSQYLGCRIIITGRFIALISRVCMYEAVTTAPNALSVSTVSHLKTARMLCNPLSPEAGISANWGRSQSGQIRFFFQQKIQQTPEEQCEGFW